MKRVRTSLFFMAVVGVLALCGSAWGVESSEQIQGTISHWTFDEGSGTTAYDSAGNNDGTIYGVTWTTGQIDGALSFDGVDDYVDCGNGADLDGMAAITLSAWIHPKGWGGHNYGRILSKMINPYAAYEFIVNGNPGTNRIDACFYGDNDTAVVRSSSDSISLNQWFHVAATNNGSQQKIYVNGVVSGAANVNTGNIRDVPVNLWIGQITSAYVDRAFRGIIDDVRIYNKALSAEEIQQLYQDGFPDVVGLEIIGPGEVAENFRAGYKAIAYYDDDSTMDVTDSALWAVEPNTAANIDDYGVLTTQDIVKDQSATILASYTEGDVTFDAEKAIDILAICPTGTALQYDGVNDYVDCGNGAGLDGMASITLSAWIHPKGWGGNNAGRIISKRVYPYSAYELAINGVSGYNFVGSGFYGDNNIVGVHSANNSISLNQWFHVAATSNGSQQTIYVNGVESGSSNVNTGNIRDVPVNLWIGQITSAYVDVAFDGIIDDVRIYDRALSAEEIQANMYTRLVGNEPGLVGYWDFDEGEGQIVYDLSGNGNDGQLGSTPNVDASDPAWVDSDAPVGICSLYQIATMAAERALGRKTALLEELQAGLAEEWTAYEALEEMLESGDYGDLNKGDIVTAKQKIHSAIQHQEQAIDALEKSIERLKDALSALGYEPEPPPPPPLLPGQASNPNPADGARDGSV